MSEIGKPRGYRNGQADMFSNRLLSEAAIEYRRDRERSTRASNRLDRPSIDIEHQKARASFVSLRRASDVEATPISWIWPGWLARGKMHILAGQPGAGKTTLALKLAASISGGLRWPDDAEAPRGNVLIWSGEDDQADTLVPRLLAAGADVRRISFLESTKENNQDRPFDPAKDIPLLKREIEKIGGAALIIIDPIVSAVAVDSHKNGETRRALQPLVDLARETGAAILGIHHFSKGTAGREPIERIIGSIAFSALARIVLIAGKEMMQEDEGNDHRFLVRAKSNIDRDGGGFLYRLELRGVSNRPDLQASVVVWEGSCDGTAQEMLGAAEAPPRQDPN